MITQIINALSSIPNVVWSGLIASLVAFGGVFLSNRSNTKRLIIQLEHDSKEKEKDRFNSLRKEVYLKAAEEASRAGNHLGKIPTLDPIKTDLGEGLSEFFATSAKLQLISQPETSEAAAELTTRYAEMAAALMTKASPIHNANAKIRISGDFYETNQSEVNRILAEMKRLDESSALDDSRLLSLSRSLENSQKAAEHFLKEREDAWGEHEIAMREYMNLLMQEMKETFPLQNRLMRLIRIELNVGENPESSDAHDNRFNRISKIMNNFIEASPEKAKTLILTDIEGTTSSISFVKDVLFPYARRALPGFVRERGHEPEVRRWLDTVATEHGAVCDEGVIVEILQGWIDEDRKHTALKALQGMIWQDGYRSADFTAHIYPDAATQLRAWHAAGFALAVYSSGSVPAQKLFFGHSDAGDLTGLFDAWFDTEVGHKREAGSYRTIAQRLGRAPDTILFLSDVVEELDAARQAGMRTVLVDRLDDYPMPRLGEATHGHRRVERFDAIDPEAP